ncbi:CybS-domain-containing protein [Halteromyces radiatus]|uniref:CybS-domain-containing protein n=1 Tax=Halteromyces radiatus TaxID=101107 RepID=UPI00221F68C5|nr:CybS-domain-containing protein [Halteromyces radiatus]KAI8086200.1 CybS-domain-containing protein [Halteromyces radiatus]
MLRPTTNLTRLTLRSSSLPFTIVRRSYSATKQSDVKSTSDKPVETTIQPDITTVNDDLVKSNDTAQETYEEREKRMKRNEIGYAFGANHWNLERASAVALVPLLSTQFIYGAHPIVDGLVSVVLPYHIYMGFDSCITDYIPKRVYPRGYKAAMLSLKVSMALTIWGCYEFNTNDVGITEAIQRIWTA